MAKVSRGRATRQDPEQEELVQRKDRINERVKELIDLLIETKRSWNGKPAPSIGVNEPHSITEPLPEETTQAMDKIVQMVQDVESDLDQISQQQSGHSSNRSRPEGKDSKDEEPFDLSAIASSGVGRFMSHIKAPFQFGDSDKWERLKLLRAVSKVSDNFSDIQGTVLSSDDMAIPNAVLKLKDMFHMFDNEIVEPILEEVRKLPERPGSSDSDSESKPGAPGSDTIEDQDGFSEESSNPYDNFTAHDLRVEMDAMHKEIKMAIMRLETPELRRMFSDEFHNVRSRMKNVHSLMESDLESALREYENLEYAKDELVASIDEATAQEQNNQDENMADFEKSANRFSNWLKRKNVKHFESSSSPAKKLKLRVDKDISSIRKDIDSFMDALQKKNVSVSSLTSYVNGIVKKMISVYEAMIRLSDIHNSSIKRKKYKAKQDGEKFKLDTVTSSDVRSLYTIIKELKNIETTIGALKELHA